MRILICSICFSVARVAAWYRAGEIDVDIVVNYLKSMSKLEAKISGRITIVA